MTVQRINFSNPVDLSDRTPEQAEGGEAFKAALAYETENHFQVQSQNNDVNTLNNALSLERNVPLPGRPGVYLISNLGTLSGTNSTDSDSNTKLSLSIPLTAFSEVTLASSENVKAQIQKNLSNTLGLNAQTITLPDNLSSQLDAIKSSSLGALATSQGWKLSPQIVVTVDGSDTVRNSAKVWAANAVNSPYGARLSDGLKIADNSNAQSDSAGIQANVNVGFSLSGPSAMLFWRLGQDSKDITLGILGRDNLQGTNNTTNSHEKLNISITSSSNSVTIDVPGVAEINLPKDFTSALNNFLK